MAETNPTTELKYGFYNAEYKNGEYDRTYDAADFNSLLAMIYNEGILPWGSGSVDNSFATVKQSNNVVAVMPGIAFLDGTWNILDGLLKLNIPTTGSLCGIVLEVDKANRTNRIFVKECGNAQKVSLTRNSFEQINQYCLAAVFVANGAITRIERCIGRGESYCASPTPIATLRIGGASGSSGSSGTTTIDASAYTTAIKFKGNTFDLSFKNTNGLTYTNHFTVTENNGKITKITNNTVGRSIAINYEQ